MYKLGIDIGSSTIKIIVMDEKQIIFKWDEKHFGKITECLKKGLLEVNKLHVQEVCVGILGNNGLIDHIQELESIPAIVEGSKYLVLNANSVIEIGSQGSRYITNIQTVPSFSTNEHCAGGTGSFFEDQMSRLNMKIEDYSLVVEKATSIPRLSGRCAVFAKTDIIHRQQEGVSTPDILLGLCYAMMRNYKATIIGKLPLQKPVLFCGGVTKNSGMQKAIKDVLKLNDEELIIPQEALYVSAIGASILASEIRTIDALLDALEHVQKSTIERLEQLHIRKENILHDPITKDLKPNSLCTLGIDIGSTSTDLVIIDEESNLIDYQYLRTSGNPEEAVRKGLQAIKDKYGEIPFKAIGVTGSGRERIGRLIGADTVKDEITAQARGASFAVKDVDTVFEIGGQDSKFIRLENGNVIDFQMNKICAAGTGSFVEEQASRMSIPINEFGPLALESKHPVDLGERCTVFIETAIQSALAEGASQKDIAAGLCYSIIKNYLHKVVGSKNIGKKIVLQGGVNYNVGIVAAFETVYGNSVTVNPYFSISGALGVALLAQEECTGTTKFKGYNFSSVDVMTNTISEDIQRNIAFYNQSNALLLEGYTGKIDPKKKTVGVPYVLMIHKFFPMANAFFTSLGYNVVLTSPTNEETIRLSQEYARGETCYPVKLIYGHMKQLIDQKVDYIFLPTIHTMKHASSHVEHNYGCVYMQTAAVSIAKALNIEQYGIELLSPVFDLDFGQEAMASAMLGLSKILNKPKPLCLKALLSGAMAVKKHTKAVETQGEELLKSLKPEDKVLVLVTRNYGISDPILNMGIPERLLERGYKVITLSHLPAHDLDISKEYPNLYWPFGQHIISGAKLIASHPNLYAVYLTNHGCGPDTMLSHLFAQEMKDKPYLQIEVDEHFSPVGVITRIEAFLNSLKQRPVVKDMLNEWHIEQNDIQILQKPQQDKKLMILNHGYYSDYLKQYFEALGYKTEVIPSINEEILKIGRENTNTKEYLTFTTMVGSVLCSAKQEKESVQYLLPQTLGAEADGQYARVIYDSLKTNGLDRHALVTKNIENLHNEASDFDLLFRCLVLGDLSYFYGHKVSNKILSWDEIFNLVHQKEIKKKKIAVIGELAMITTLDEGILEVLEDDYGVLRNPIAEQMLFLWTDNKMNEELSNRYISYIERINKIFKEDSPYSDDFKELQQIANRELPMFSGGNGRYRYAKAIQMSKKVNAVLLLSPRYENTSMILEMRDIQNSCKTPVYDIKLDQDFDENAWSKLKSFLYYCK